MKKKKTQQKLILQIVLQTVHDTIFSLPMSLITEFSFSSLIKTHTLGTRLYQQCLFFTPEPKNGAQQLCPISCPSAALPCSLHTFSLLPGSRHKAEADQILDMADAYLAFPRCLESP